MIVTPIRTRVFKEGENLEAFVMEHVPVLSDDMVLVVTSKIVALAEGRTADPKDREKIIEEESELVIRTKYTWLTIKDGTVMASAGVDESNADGKLVLLPKDSFVAAEALCAKLLQRFGLKNLGILITDSRFIPLRAGAAGVALGYAGFKGVRDYRGTTDILVVFSRLSAPTLPTALPPRQSSKWAKAQSSGRSASSKTRQSNSSKKSIATNFTSTSKTTSTVRCLRVCDIVACMETREYSYSIQIEPAKEGGFWSRVPALPGCFSQGETVDETIEHTKEAIAFYVE